jgi:hypothetical protein
LHITLHHSPKGKLYLLHHNVHFLSFPNPRVPFVAHHIPLSSLLFAVVANLLHCQGLCFYHHQLVVEVFFIEFIFAMNLLWNVGIDMLMVMIVFKGKFFLSLDPH